MGVRLVPYSADLEPAVDDFNRRLALAGWDQRFPARAMPETLARGSHPKLVNEMFLAVDDGVVRGGYILKHQEFMLAGEPAMIANYAFPLSEGVVDRRFGMVGVSMIVDAQKRNPLLFGLGMGGLDHPSVRVMQGMRWSAIMVPFHFRILRPARFCRNIMARRRSQRERLLMDALAYSGAGWLGVRTHALLRRRSGGTPHAEQVDEFGAWADDVWAAQPAMAGMAAVRDSSVLRLLYPRGGRQLTLRVGGSRETLGWAVCLDTQMAGNPYFGDMRVGTLVDCLARPGAEAAVVEAADALLAQRGVDLIVSNQTRRTWRTALERSAYLEGPSNFALTCSKALIDRIGPLASVLGECHINRGDGDGPINL